ncbi:hypothetical protein HDZ31DRAFT_66831 [Schizophyllum fasciatum]
MPTVNTLSNNMISEFTTTSTPTTTFALDPTTTSSSPYSSLPRNSLNQPLHYAGALFFVLGVCIILIAVTIYSWIKRYSRIKNSSASRDQSQLEEIALANSLGSSSYLPKRKRSSSSDSSTMTITSSITSELVFPKRLKITDARAAFDPTESSAASSTTTLVESTGKARI